MTNLVVIKNQFGSYAIQENDKIILESYQREGCFERAVVEFLRDRCFPEGKGTLIDAGAHIGLTSIPIALRHPGVQVFAFEPEATNFALLEMNVKGNKVGENCFPRQLALSDKTGSATMIRDPGRTVDHRMLRGRSGEVGVDGEDKRVPFTVSAARLDSRFEEDFRAAFPGPVVLKLDVQGHEAAVMRGALALDPDIVVFEFWPYALAREGETEFSLQSLFGSFPFGTILIESTAITLSGLHLDIMRSIPWRPNVTTNVNLVASKKRIL